MAAKTSGLAVAFAALFILLAGCQGTAPPKAECGNECPTGQPTTHPTVEPGGTTTPVIVAPDPMVQRQENCTALDALLFVDYAAVDALVPDQLELEVEVEDVARIRFEYQTCERFVLDGRIIDGYVESSIFAFVHPRNLTWRRDGYRDMYSLAHIVSDTTHWKALPGFSVIEQGTIDVVAGAHPDLRTITATGSKHGWTASTIERRGENSPQSAKTQYWFGSGPFAVMESVKTSKTSGVTEAVTIEIQGDLGEKLGAYQRGSTMSTYYEISRTGNIREESG